MPARSARIGPRPFRTCDTLSSKVLTLIRCAPTLARVDQMAESPVAVKRKRGRPRTTGAQTAILEAATALFAANGFSGTSLRDIAEASKSDPALVIRHFGSKEGLFLRTMTVDEGYRGLVEGPIGHLARLMLQRLIEQVDPSTVLMYSAIIGALDRAEVREYLQRSTQRHIVEPLAARLSGPNSLRRARLVAAQVGGLRTALWVSKDPTLLADPLGAVLDDYAIGLQAVIDG